MASSTLSVDGNNVTKIGGPYPTATGANFSGTFGTLAAGSHSYIITATDKLGNSSSLSGTFTVPGATNPGPVIGGVYVPAGTGTMSWSATDAAGLSSATLKVDGKSVTPVFGPYPTATGANFSAAIGTLAAGSHTYVITATDKLGKSSTLNGTFTVSAVSNPGPVIGGVYIPAGTGTMSWSAADAAGLSSATLKIDGKSVTPVFGPYPTATGANFSAAIGALAAGSHTYAITATDKLGKSSTLNGTFTMAAATNPGPVISAVYIPAGAGVMSWNAFDSAGVASSSLTVDGVTVSPIYGPSPAASGVNFSGQFGTLAAGTYSYVITATDKLGNSSTYNGTFTVASSGGGGNVYAKSLAHGAVMQSLSTSVTTSAKVDWLYDEVPASLSDADDGTSADAVDAVLAAYV